MCLARRPLYLLCNQQTERMFVQERLLPMFAVELKTSIIIIIIIHYTIIIIIITRTILMLLTSTTEISIGVIWFIYIEDL